MILARKIVTLSKAELDGRSVAFGIPYRFSVGKHNENHDFIEQKRVFDFLGEDLGHFSSSFDVADNAQEVIFLANVAVEIIAFPLRNINL